MEKTSRIDFYDNLKFILITLVVVGHFIQFQLDSDASKGLFLFIYSFHMPLFIFVTGLLSKSVINGDSKKRLNKIISYLIIYLGYKIFLYIIFNFVLNQPYSFSLFSEMEVPWYLFAVIVWIILTNLIKDIKPLISLTISVICCLLVGYDSNITDQFCLSRVIVFFPFFLSGYYLSLERMKKFIYKLHNCKWKFILAFVLLCLFCFIFIYFGDILYFLRPLFTGRNPYVYFDLPFDIPFSALLLRLIWIFYNVFIGVLVLMVVPLNRTFYTKYGGRTLQIFVLHFVVAACIGYSFVGRSIVSFFGDYSVLIFIVIGVLTTFIFSSKIFSKVFSEILKLNYKKLYK